MIYSTQRRQRRGTVLVLFALIVFALMALVALVIDLGFVRLTQQEMRTGTDAAAIEGLRWRDTAPPASWNLMGDADQDRRQLASQLNALQYDADYNLATTDNQYGAGPVISFTGGVTEANALQTVTGTSVYKPDLQSNIADNELGGDMVSGAFMPPQPPQPSTESGTQGPEPEYTRNDFTPSPVGTAATAPSFLVRMRRTEDPRETATNTAGVSSVGPSLPLLFGRGSMVAKDPSTSYSVRQHGLTVRSTSIADAKRAKSVGPAYPPGLYPNVTPPGSFPGIQGVAPFALSLTYWKAATGANDPATVQANGAITTSTGSGQLIRITSLTTQVQPGDTTLVVVSAAGFPSDPATGALAVPFNVRIDQELLQVTAVSGGGAGWTVARAQEGSQAALHAADSPVLLHAGMGLGRVVSAATADPNNPPMSSPRPTRLDLLAGATTGETFLTYVAVFDDSGQFGDTGNLVIGFGLLKWTVSSWNSANGFKLLLTKQPATVAVSNASAAFTQPLPRDLTADQLNHLLILHGTLATSGSANASLLAPALVR